ncbi:hypothetical protein MMC07_001336 [Pseudocyphellaria aurata]|nr:hypothetical protein [Pseudocyphellaria aurata]
MSFGFSVGDFAALGQLAWKIYKACKDAPDSFKNLSQEVSSLHLVLKEVEETFSDSALSASQQSRLESVGDGCRVILEDLQCSLDKYNSLGTKSKRTWDRIGWGSNDIAELRLRLISNTVMLTTLVNTSQINVQKKLDVFKQEYRDGKREGSMMSAQTVDSLSADERQAWRAIRKELEDIGISVEAFDANKDFIVNWFKTAISTGAFEEQKSEAETSSILDEDDLTSWENPKRGTLLTQHLEDPETGSNLPSTSIKLQALKLSSEAKGQRRRPPRIAGLINWLFRNNDRLRKAVQNGDETKVRELLEKGVDINMQDDYGMTPLHDAVLSNSEGIARLLLRKGAEIHTKDGDQRTALHLAVEKSYESMAQLLLDNGAQINSKDWDESTELHSAVRNRDERVAKLLLEHGAKTEEKDAGGSTALHEAARLGDEKIVNLLLEHDAKIEEKDRDGNTALHRAVRAGKATVVQLLLENGAIVVGKDQHGLTLLHYAVSFNDQSEALLMLQLLLNHGANPNEQFSRFEDTALHWAVNRGREVIVRLLLAKSAEIDKFDTLGMTALHLAAAVGEEKIVQILLDNGADIDKVDTLGRTALDLAAVFKQRNILQILSNNGARLTRRPTGGSRVSTVDQDGLLPS